MRDIRLGDDIDDFCVRCKRVMNHAVVSVISAAPAKVRCRTCHSDHDYRHEQAPPPKVDARKAALFQEVLKKVDPDAPAVVDADVEDVPEVEIEAGAEAGIEADAEADTDVDVEMAIVEDAPPVREAPKPKAKAKPKAKGKARK
jgi:hypothetical protein